MILLELIFEGRGISATQSPSMAGEGGRWTLLPRQASIAGSAA